MYIQISKRNRVDAQIGELEIILRKSYVIIFEYMKNINNFQKM